MFMRMGTSRVVMVVMLSKALRYPGAACVLGVEPTHNHPPFEPSLSLKSDASI